MTARRRISARQRARNRAVILLHCVGLTVGPMHLLTVPGRTTGLPRTTPLAPVVIDGVQYIVQAYPQSDWVKNARAAGHGVLTRGRHRQAVDLVEVPEAQRGPILREFPRQNRRGVGAFIRNGLVTSDTPDSFASAAPRCPVFRAPARTDTPHNSAQRT